MAFLPNLPTSFVPHSTATPQRFRSDLTGAFGFFAYVVLGIALALAFGVFFYGRILAASQSSKDDALAKAEAGIDQTTVENFVRLRDRLFSGDTLLSNHLALSSFFALLETLMPATVRFTTLHVSVDDTGKTQIEGAGVAKSFNALAATSMGFAQSGRIKDAIFSNITVNSKDSSVSFALSALLDPKVIAFSPNTSTGALPPSSASTTTP